MLCVLAFGNTAGAYSLIGAETLKTNERALRVGFGYPALSLAYFIPITDRFDLAPSFTFFYGSPAFHVPFIGDSLGVELRFAVIKRPKFSLAVTADLKLVLSYHPGGFGLGLGLITPGVVITGKVSNAIRLSGGLSLPLLFTVVVGGSGTFVAVIPIQFRLGVEGEITPRLSLFFNVDVGPQIVKPRNVPAGVSVWFIATLGIGYKF